MTGDGPLSKPTTMNKNAKFGKTVYRSGQTGPALFLELFPIAIVPEVARSIYRSLTPFPHPTRMNALCSAGDIDRRRLVHIIVRRHS
jgi:hypothetical protein